jgi:hypothetical protein
LPFPDANILSSWNDLSGEELMQAVANAYRPKD